MKTKNTIHVWDLPLRLFHWLLVVAFLIVFITELDEMKAGHGLGLAIVKYMIQQHGGQLKLNQSSQLGGLSVDITL